MRKAILLSSLIFASMSSYNTVNAQVRGALPTNQELAITTEKPYYNTVNIIDKNLQTTYTYRNGQSITTGKIAVENAGQDILKNGLREVWVQLRNLTDYPQAILARTTWYDERGRAVDGPSSWTRIFLSQNSGEVYESISIRPTSNSFMVEIQEVR